MRSVPLSDHQTRLKQAERTRQLSPHGTTYFLRDFSAGRTGGARGATQMQKCMYDRAMAHETRNGASVNNNNNNSSHSKRKLLVALDVFCLLLGTCTSRPRARARACI